MANASRSPTICRKLCARSSVIFVAVGTPPTERGEADLSYVESVAREISGGINDYKVIVEKSTVPVYTSEWVRKIILRNGTNPESFDVASNPEFLREGTAVTDFLFPDRIVIGCDTERAANVLREVYAPLTSGSYYERTDAIPQPDRAPIPAPIIVTTTKSAELIKHASNAFLALKISFINAVASICESVGANVNQVCNGIGTDSRIGPRFLNPGIGYGGSCFPKDVMAFRAVARECGYDFRLLDEVMRINEDQRRPLSPQSAQRPVDASRQTPRRTRPGLQRWNRRHSRITRAFPRAGSVAGRLQDHGLRSRRHGANAGNDELQSQICRLCL